jgi:hypothetical protein
MAINIKNRCTAAKARVGAFIEASCAQLSADLEHEWATARVVTDCRWDKLEAELLAKSSTDNSDLRTLLALATVAAVQG